MTTKKIVSFIIKFGITIGIFYYLISSGKLNFQKLYVFWEKPIILVVLLVVLLFASVSVFLNKVCNCNASFPTVLLLIDITTQRGVTLEKDEPFFPRCEAE